MQFNRKELEAFAKEAAKSIKTLKGPMGMWIAESESAKKMVYLAIT